MSEPGTICGACGAPNDPAAIVCVRCGALLAAYQTPTGAALVGQPVAVDPAPPSPVDPVETPPITTTLPPALPSTQPSLFPAGHTVLGRSGPISLSTTPPPRSESEPATVVVPRDPMVTDVAAALPEELVVARVIEAEPAGQVDDQERLEPVKIAWIDSPFESDDPQRPSPSPPPRPAPRRPEWARMLDQPRQYPAGKLYEQLRPTLGGARAGASPHLISIGVAVLGFSCVAFTIGGAIDGAECIASLGMFGIIVAIALIGAGLSKRKR